MPPPLDLPEGDDDELLFADEDEDEVASGPTEHWKALIVDDDEEVHNVTKLALGDFVFEGKGLELVSAHSAAEARELIQRHQDTAVILLDVVMERDDAGLQFVRTLRDEMGNRTVRVILRTGQPGQAPEQSVIVDYDINDYKTKPELTSQKLFTTMVVALRSYRDLLTIEARERQLRELNETLEDRVRERTRELEEAQTQVVQASKMASLGKLVAGVAHEINNPIASVMSSQTNLAAALGKIRASVEKDTDASAKLLAWMRIVEESSSVIDLGAKRVAEIVKRLRSFARLDEAELKPVDLNACVRDAVGLLDHELSDITLSTELDDLPTVICYPGRLNQVFLSILTNAAEAMDGNGSIQITSSSDDRVVSVSVRDHGPGIPESILPRIFDPGFTTKGGGIGTGLGLAICYQIVTDHGGELLVESPGDGAMLTVRLPIDTRLA